MSGDEQDPPLTRRGFLAGAAGLGSVALGVGGALSLSELAEAGKPTSGWSLRRFDGRRVQVG